MRTASILFLAMLAFLAACSEKHAPEQGEGAGTMVQADQHGQPGAVPGSHEDWCGAHAVPESKCTRCDPSLIAAFKATNDWCAEHGLPESQCLKCNPELKIVRSPKAE
jgi:hypothetical protein